MMKAGNSLVSILLLVLLLGHTSSQHIVRAQVMITEEVEVVENNGESNADIMDMSAISLDFGDFLGAVGNATQDFGGLLGGLLGNATDFLSGLFGGSTNQTQNNTLDLSVLLDFVDDTFGIDLGNLTVTLDSLLEDLNEMSNDTVSLDINKIINSALSCNDLLTLAGAGLPCLTNLEVDESAPPDPNNCTPECKSAFEQASQICPDFVRAIFGDVGLSEVCGLPVIGAPTPATAPATAPAAVPVAVPLPSPTIQVPTTPSSTPSTPDVSGVVQGGEAVPVLGTSSAVAKGFLYTSMVIAIVLF